MITVYGQPGCQPCKLATAYLDRHDVPHTYVDLTEHPELIEKFRAAGKTSTPILQTPTETTSGFNPQALTRAVDEYRASEHELPPTGPDPSLTR